MSFHDRGFNSRNGFDSQSSRVPVLSYDRGNDVLRRGGVSPGPILECDDIQIQSPGVTQCIRSGRVMTGGPSELTPTVTEVIFVRAWFYHCAIIAREALLIE